MTCPSNATTAVCYEAQGESFATYATRVATLFCGGGGGVADGGGDGGGASDASNDVPDGD